MKASPILQDDLGKRLRVWRGRSSVMSRAHSHADLELNYVLAGTMRYLIQGRIVTLPSQRLCLLWGAISHQTLRGTVSPQLVWVTVPMAMVWKMRLGKAFLGKLMKTGVIVDPQPTSRDESMLLQWCDDMHDDVNGQEDRRERIVRLEVTARLHRLAMAWASSHRRRSSPVTPRRHQLSASPAVRHVQVMARHIADHLGETLSVEDIAAAAHLSANHAMTLFRRHTGLTLWTYLTRQRIAAAQRLLTTTDRPVLQIGYDCGFGSVSRFYEAFRDQTGDSPAAYRRSQRRIQSEHAD